MINQDKWINSIPKTVIKSNEAANQVIDSNYYRQLPNRAGRLVKRLRSLHGSI